MSDINRVRRYYLIKRLTGLKDGDEGLVSMWQAKQEAEPGVALPADFPSRAKLVACGYTTAEDVHGADSYELAAFVSLSNAEADAVIAAASLLI